jgi:nucleotide-binding universal stress UspA family protein
MFQRILIGFDGSPQAEKAVETALSLARYMDSTVVIFAVARPPEPATRVEVSAVLDNAREHFEADFKRIVKGAQAEGIEIETEIAVGHPAEHIIHKAEAAKADLIIIGTRGTSTFKKWMLGSTSERVLRYAHCPVLVVR